MKFTCDSCNAQYMISDDKVGPTGVKVRCKKCGHVITVRRGEEAAAAAPTAPTSSPSGDGLDAELGSAFDSAFGEKPPAPAPGPDLDATQAMSPGDAQRIAGASASTEWYVAIGEAQVGPLPIADVKRKWEQGDVGPDSLVWRPGMGDWSPLSTIAELAAVLSPIPRPAAARVSAPVAAAPRTGTPVFGTPAAAPAPAAPAAPSTAAPDATWKPAGASALAALASEELQARAPVVAESPKPAAKGAGARSLVEQMNLADQGGVEPTGALPLSIKGVERTDESPIRRKSSVATRQAEIRQKRGTTRVVVGVLVLVVALVAAGAVGVIAYLDKLPPGLAALAGKESPPEPAPAPAPPPPPAPAVAAAVPAAPPPAAAEPAPAPAPPPAPVASAPAPAPAKVASAPRTPRAPAARTPVATREAPPPPPPPPKAKPRSDSLLDGIDGGGDDALADALGSGTGRSVYVPPKPGGSANLPDQVTDGQVTEAIRGKFEQLATCADVAGADGAVVVMRWAITPEGGTRDVKCAAPCGNTAVSACLSPVLKSIRFPRSVNGRARVEFPFKF